MRRLVLALLPLLVAASGCGSTVVDDEEGAGGGVGTSTGTTSSSTASGSAEAPRPTALYVSDRGGCALEAPIGEAEASLTPGDGTGLVEALLVVELVFADECTGAGGQHIVARATDGAMMWLGEHACSFFEPDLLDGRVHAGVARVFEDDHSEAISDSVCISFPGEDPPIESDLGVLAIAVFASMADADAFAASID